MMGCGAHSATQPRAEPAEKIVTVLATGNRLHNYGKSGRFHAIYVGKLPISMAIFNSYGYAKLPEGENKLQSHYGLV